MLVIENTNTDASVIHIGSPRKVTVNCISNNNEKDNDVVCSDVSEIEDLEAIVISTKEENEREVEVSLPPPTIPSWKMRLQWCGIYVETTSTTPSLCNRMMGCCGKTKALPIKKKIILRNVSGTAEPNSMLAIMGASGSGKTSLLNVLSQQVSDNVEVSGTILLNNKKVKANRMNTIAAYVRQDNSFIPTLTVYEHLRFQALLRMGSEFTIREKEQRVKDLMAELSLLKCRDTIIGNHRLRGISGGEMKRLSFASEIITNPRVLLVDEPTSGLDSFMAESVVLALKRLASEGRTVICSVHQPSSSVFQLFDKVLLLSEGRVAYTGDAEQAAQFFERAGHPCPRNFNPADHYIRTLAILPGKEEACMAKTKAICDAFEKENFRNTTCKKPTDVPHL